MRVEIAAVCATILIAISSITISFVSSSETSTPEMGRATSDIYVLSFYEDSEATLWNLTIANVPWSYPLSLSDVTIRTTGENGYTILYMMQLRSMVPGQYYSGVCFMDLTQQGYLSAGDYFLFDKNVYAANSSIAFLTYDGAGEFGFHFFGNGPPSPPPASDFWKVEVTAAASLVSIGLAMFVLQIRKIRKRIKG